MKILIEVPSWIGDCIMATPAIQNIIEAHPDSQIYFLGPSNSISLFKYHPNCIKLILLKKSFYEFYATVRKLEHIDIFFSFRSSFRTKFFKIFLTAKKKYQYDKNVFNNGHQVERYCDFINHSLCQNFSAGELKIYLDIPPLSDKHHKTIGINPGGSYGSAKRWHPDKFIKVINQLPDDFEVIIFGNDNDATLGSYIERNIKSATNLKVRNLCGKTSINQLCNYISQLDLLITGDSGPMHIAAAFKIPSICIFGPTKYKETSQWGNPNHKIIRTNLPCQPCMKRECPLGHHDCMNNIKAKEVVYEVRRFTESEFFL